VADGAVADAAVAAFDELSASVADALAQPVQPSVLTAAANWLSPAEIVSNAAVMLFGGIETTEGMICNALWYLLGDRAAWREVMADRGMIGNAVEEALRLEPAAAVVDRYASADVILGDSQIGSGDLVRVSLSAANRDPAVFADPDRFDVHRGNARQHRAFAIGPHFCVGAELARTEAHAAVSALLDRLPGLRLDPGRPSAPEGLVFRKPASLHVSWETS
jgi:cytochrome P450